MILYNSIDDLAHEFYLDSQCLDGVVMIGDYDIIIDVANYLLKDTDDCMLHFADITDDLEDYDHEYCLSLGGDGEIWIEKAYNQCVRQYLDFIDGKVYVYGNVSQKCLDHIEHPCKFMLIEDSQIWENIMHVLDR